MRLIAIILLFTTFFSCNRDKIVSSYNGRINCDFGVKEFNYIKRQFPAGSKEVVEDKRRRPRNPSGVLFLDFDGGIVNSPYYWGVFNVDSSGLTDAQIQQVFDNCSFDYSAFNVYVTTDERFYNSFDGKKTRCIITESYQWFGNGAGGTAMIGSYNWIDETPCFVFSLLLNYNTKFIKEAVSHEIGHTLGLYHQSVYDSLCNKLSEYNSGCCGQAPIMGIGYYQPNVHWWTSCEQNDSLFIKNLVGLR